MKPIDQTISDVGRGDCLRAVVASLLELEIEQVPHFVLFEGSLWWNVYIGFLWSVGYDFYGTGYPDKHSLTEDGVIGGHLLATVPSKNFDGVNHAVIINTEGLVVHDPSPNKNYQGANVVETKELLNWDLIEPRTDEAWLNWKKASES